MRSRIGITLTQHIMEEQRGFMTATGEFSELLSQIGVAGKIISAEVNRAGLADILGLTGATNVQGEEVMKLDVFANQVMTEMLARCGRVCVMASEEVDEAIVPPAGERPLGKYAIAFDPLDGSSNIDVNVSIGTIFSIYRRRTPGAGAGHAEDLLQSGRNLVGAGYIVYGSSTMLVYSTGTGVWGFTLDPSVGEFLLSHDGIKMPPKCAYYSINEGNAALWGKGTRNFVEYVKEKDPETGRPYGGRYIGSLVADFHRNLLRGGVFLYPADAKSPQGKLRLLYEAIPMAFIAEQAGGYASNGAEAILDVQPTSLHQRTPLIVGDRKAVELYEEFVRNAQ
ncbi:MAG: class 1 fructose-bisphosphatase [Candidatus Methylomirabilis sp.]|nr:class 1 fructose-bisphosphatase [Deltaproteobacteria bacterium]